MSSSAAEVDMNGDSSSSSSSSCCCPAGSLKYLPATLVADNLQGHCVSIPCASEECEFYLSLPADQKDAGSSFTVNKALILIPDVWGWNSGRVREIADYYAREGGFTVVVPKILIPALEGGTDGDALPPNFDMSTRGGEFMSYIATFPWSVLKPRVSCVIDFLQGRGASGIGMVGFCFGGWVCASAAADNDTYSSIKAIASPHPSIILEERAYKGNTVELLSRVRAPTLFLPAGNDAPEYRDTGAYIEAVRANNPLSKTIAEFDDMRHGWVNRGDVTDAAVKGQVDKALKYILDYMKELV